MIVFYSVSECSPKSVLLKFGTSWILFGKAYDPFCTEFPWANLKVFSGFSNFGTWFPDFSDSRPTKTCFGARWRFAGFSCAICYRFVYHIEHVPQTLSDAPQKLIVHTFPSIWHQPFFINIFKQIAISSKGVSGTSDFFLLYWVLVLPIGRCHSAWNH